MKLTLTDSSESRTFQETSNRRHIEMVSIQSGPKGNYSTVMQEFLKKQVRKDSQPSLSRKESSRILIRQSSKVIIKDHSVNDGDTAMKGTSIKDPLLDGEGQSQRQSKMEPAGEEEEEALLSRKIPYKFSIRSFLIENLVAYALTISILYLLKLATFSYFELILVLALTVSVQPWRLSNLIMVCAIGITIGNVFLGASAFIYPGIFICYLAVTAFNQKHPIKTLFVVAVAQVLFFSFIVLPIVSTAISKTNPTLYYYVFPLLMFVMYTVLYYIYWVIQHTSIIFLQLPLLLLGLEYGTILSRGIADIEFWYLIVTFTLQIINIRTQFTLRILVKLTYSCLGCCQKKIVPKMVALPAHAAGYSCLNSFHMVILVYVLAGLQLSAPPFSAPVNLSACMDPWFKPLIVWGLCGVYEIMCLVLQRKRQDRLLLGFVSNKWWKCILRGFVLVLGMWLFYMGLALGIIQFSTTPKA